VFCSLYCAGCFSSLNLSFFVYHRQAWPGFGSLLLLAWFSFPASVQFLQLFSLSPTREAKPWIQFPLPVEICFAAARFGSVFLCRALTARVFIGWLVLSWFPLQMLAPSWSVMFWIYQPAPDFVGTRDPFCSWR
jgi:hypothetical protein